MSKNSKNFKSNSSHRENKMRKKIRKEDFYPNHYNKEIMQDCMNEFGSMIKNAYYSKPERKKIAKSIKRMRFLAQLPYCSKHYFQIH